tara:strand:- start:562 stop:771 length:210 start_codon:yes stop_codon:yes gene_type:complete
MNYELVANELMNEPEFKPGGFVYKHITENKSNALISIKSAVDNMSDLYDLERDDIGILSGLILQKFRNK